MFAKEADLIEFRATKRISRPSKPEVVVAKTASRKSLLIWLRITALPIFLPTQKPYLPQSKEVCRK